MGKKLKFFEEDLKKSCFFWRKTQESEGFQGGALHNKLPFSVVVQLSSVPQMLSMTKHNIPPEVLEKVFFLKRFQSCENLRDCASIHQPKSAFCWKVPSTKHINETTQSITGGIAAVSSIPHVAQSTSQPLLKSLFSASVDTNSNEQQGLVNNVTTDFNSTTKLDAASLSAISGT